MKYSDGLDYNKLLFDTCVLFDLLLYNYAKQCNDRFIKDKYLNMIFNKGPESKTKYIKFFQNITKIRTSAHVIGELQGLINNRLNLKEQTKYQFWNSSIQFFKSKNLNEDLIQLMLIVEQRNYLKISSEIGYIDTGLIEIAKKNNLWIVTIDGKTLEKKAIEMGVNVIDPRFH